jgi:RNA polymerase sigma-70 factor (ECF subfamily)
VHEAYVRLVKQDQANLKDRFHFYTLAARMMRQILVDAARARNAEKRGPGKQVTLDDRVNLAGGKNALDLLMIHEALDNLHRHNPRLADGVELRYFGGLPLDEIADALAVSLATAKRDLSLGVAWLRRALVQA